MPTAKNPPHFSFQRGAKSPSGDASLPSPQRLTLRAPSAEKVRLALVSVRLGHRPWEWKAESSLAIVEVLSHASMGPLWPALRHPSWLCGSSKKRTASGGSSQPKKGGEKLGKNPRLDDKGPGTADQRRPDCQEKVIVWFVSLPSTGLKQGSGLGDPTGGCSSCGIKSSLSQCPGRTFLLMKSPAGLCSLPFVFVEFELGHHSETPTFLW